MNTKLHLDRHTCKKYDEELSVLRNEMLAMGGMVEQQLSDALQSLISGNTEQAKIVMENDAQVNQKELTIDKQCTDIVALREPVASDLRLVFAVSKSVSDLENIGDMAAHLARMGKKLAEKGYSMRYYSDLEDIGKQVQAMLKSSLDAFARLDAEAAIAAMSMEPDIKRISKALIRKLASYMTDETIEKTGEIKKTLRLLEAIRSLQRIGDLCENFCEYTIYLVKGEDIRYQDFDAVKNKILDAQDTD